MEIVRKSPICGSVRAESPASSLPRATPWVPCSPFLRPVRAKVKVNHSPILLPLQGVDVYTLIPRALPWAMNWQPFQGAPFRALFVYHVRCLATCYMARNRAEIFLDFAPTYLPSLSFRAGPHRCSCNSCRQRGRYGQ